MMIYLRAISSIFILHFAMTACNNAEINNVSVNQANELAKIVGVECIGQPNNYVFNVTIESEETGCNQYADWWEVISEDGSLIYRRILTHSHVDEQPFTRGGGTIDVGADEFIYVRAHMNNEGYGSIVYSGTPREELTPDVLPASFAIELAEQEPLPEGCDF